MNQECIVCGNKVGMMGNRLGKYRWICSKCTKKAGGILNFGSLKAMNDEEIRSLVENNGGIEMCTKNGSIANLVSGRWDIFSEDYLSLQNERKSKFISTRSIENYMEIDEKNELIHFYSTSIRGALKSFMGLGKGDYYTTYKDVIGFELLENGTSVTKGGLGATVAGGMLFGAIGALAGSNIGSKKTKQACTSLQVKVTLNDMETPSFFIDIIEGRKVKNTSVAYKNAMKTAQNIISILQIICNDNEQNLAVPEKTTSAADEIKKYKELLDIGAITEKEFELKKKQLLEL